MGLYLLRFFITDFVHNTRLSYESLLRTNPWVSNSTNHVIPATVEACSETSARRPTDGRRHIIFMGQVASHKGITVLMDAFAEVARKHSDLHLDVVGGCDPEMKRELDLLADALNISSHMT